MKNYETSINESLTPTKSQLEKLYKEVSSTVDKIGNREKYLNRELDGILDTYRLVYFLVILGQFRANSVIELCKISCLKLRRSIKV